MKIDQLIDMPLWNRAQWKGVAFGYDPRRTPFVALVFDDRDAGMNILKGIRSIVGDDDGYNLLRIAFIEGDMPGEPPGYTVHIGMNYEGLAAKARAEHEVVPETLLMVSRVHRMNPPGGQSPHLAGFKQEFRRQGQYLLVPGCFSAEGELQIGPDGVMKKRHVIFRSVIDIRPTDYDDPDQAIFARETEEPMH